MGEVVKLVREDNIIEKFIDRFRSEDTKKTYKKAIKSFFGVEIVGNERLRKVEFSDIEKYVKKMIEKNMSNNSIKTNIAALKSLFKYAKFQGAVRENWFDGEQVKDLLKINLDKDVVDVGVALNKEEVERILEGIRDKRDYLIVKILFTLGVRRSELVNIKWNDFVRDDNLGSWFLKIKGKGRKEREVKIKDELMEMIKENFEWKFGEAGSCDRRLFEMTDGNVEKIVKKYARRVGIEISPHDCRRSALTRLIVNGAPLDVVKNYSGHSKLETLMERYYKPVMNRKINGSDWMDL
jgi:integrase